MLFSTTLGAPCICQMNHMFGALESVVSVLLRQEIVKVIIIIIIITLHYTSSLQVGYL